MDTSLAPTAGVSFDLTPSSSSSAARSTHRRSNSLSGLVRLKSYKRKSLTPTTPTSQSTSSTAAAGPELTSIISRGFGRASAEVPRRAEPSSDIQRPSDQRHSINLPSTQITPFHISTLPIIQPRTTATWNSSYDLDRRSFRVNLHNPRQQVTSLLALSSIPRPLTPPFDEERENTASVILAATRSAMEEEAIQAAIAASLQPEDPSRSRQSRHRLQQESHAGPHHWADHHRCSQAAIMSPRDIISSTPSAVDDHEPNSRTTIELDWTEGARMARMMFNAVPDDGPTISAVGTGGTTSSSTRATSTTGRGADTSTHQELLQQQLSHAYHFRHSRLTPTQANPFPSAGQQQQQQQSNSRAFSNSHNNASTPPGRPSPSSSSTPPATRMIHLITKINKTNRHSSSNSSPSSSSSDSQPHSSPSSSPNSSFISSSNSFLPDSPCPSNTRLCDSPFRLRCSHPSRSPPQHTSPSHRRR